MKSLEEKINLFLATKWRKIEDWVWDRDLWWINSIDSEDVLKVHQIIDENEGEALTTNTRYIRKYMEWRRKNE